MPRVTIAPENRVGEREEKFPQLKLKLDERRRIWCPPDPVEKRHTPWREWVHNLKAPIMKDGEAQKDVHTRDDGSTYETFKTTFIGAPICLGDLGILMDKAVDEANCPVCEYAVAQGRVTFKPQVRYASEVVVYGTKQGGWDLAAPFTATILVWSYPAGRYGKLVDITESEKRDLAAYDLRLGPCEKPESYQKYEIQALATQQPAWSLTDATKAYVRELWTTEGNRPNDDQLRDACGRTQERAYMLEGVKRASQMWDMAEHASSAGGADTFGAEFGGGGAALATGLDSLLGDSGAAAPEVAAQVDAARAEAQQGLQETLNPDPLAAPAPAAQAAPAEGDMFATPQAPDTPAGETVSFEDLLGGL